LSQLTIGSAELTDSTASTVGGFKRLRSLTVAGGAIGQQTIEAIYKLPIESLTLVNVKLPPHLLRRFAQTASLRRLNLTSVKLDDAGLAAISAVGQLDYISLTDCSGISARSLTAMLARLPHVRAIDLTGVLELTDEDVEAIARRYPRLRVIARVVTST